MRMAHAGRLRRPENRGSFLPIFPIVRESCVEARIITLRAGAVVLFCAVDLLHW